MVAAAVVVAAQLAVVAWEAVPLCGTEVAAVGGAGGPRYAGGGAILCDGGVGENLPVEGVLL